jgi:hypothetical protein
MRADPNDTSESCLLVEWRTSPGERVRKMLFKAWGRDDRDHWLHTVSVAMATAARRRDDQKTGAQVRECIQCARSSLSTRLRGSAPDIYRIADVFS